jgi:hypothetical protein
MHGPSYAEHPSGFVASLFPAHLSAWVLRTLFVYAAVGVLGTAIATAIMLAKPSALHEVPRSEGITGGTAPTTGPLRRVLPATDYKGQVYPTGSLMSENEFDQFLSGKIVVFNIANWKVPNKPAATVPLKAEGMFVAKDAEGTHKYLEFRQLKLAEHSDIHRVPVAGSSNVLWKATDCLFRIRSDDVFVTFSHDSPTITWKYNESSVKSVFYWRDADHGKARDDPLSMWNEVSFDDFLADPYKDLCRP